MLRKQTLTYALHTAVFLALFVAAKKYLSGDELLTHLQQFDYRYFIWMLLLALGFLFLEAWRFVILMRPVSEDVPWWPIFKGFLASHPLILLPGGVAGRAGLMHQLGIPIGKSAPAVAFSSGMDHIVFIVGTLIAAFWFAAARTPILIIMGVLLLLGLIMWLPLTRSWLVRAADWLAVNFRIQKQWQQFWQTMPQIVTWPIMSQSLVLTVLALGCKVAALALALRGVGLVLPITTVILAYLLPTMLGRIIPTPGGVGTTEAGMIGFLVTTATLDVNITTAAVTIFRITAVLLLALFGAVVYYASWCGEAELAHPHKRSTQSLSEKRFVV